jgi:hypothetical protein
MCSLCLWAGAQSRCACESRRHSCPLAVVKRRWAKNDGPAHLACPLPVSTGRFKIPVEGTHDTFADGAERASIARQLLHRGRTVSPRLSQQARIGCDRRSKGQQPGLNRLCTPHHYAVTWALWRCDALCSMNSVGRCCTYPLERSDRGGMDAGGT